MRRATNQSFEKFYYDKVGMGEACGCAERIIDVHEFNRLAGQPKTIRPVRMPGFLRPVRRLVQALKRRKSAPAD